MSGVRDQVPSGRVDGDLRVRGFRVDLGPIEQALLTHPGVRQAAVAVHADPTGGGRLVGYTVGPAKPEELAKHLRDRLPGYMVPGQWIVLDAMPLGSTGEIKRAALSAPAAAPSATTAKDLVMAWFIELLELSEVTEDTDFFVVGGHSLVASLLISRVKATFGVELAMSVVFDNPRLADFAAVVTQAADQGE